MPFSNTHRGARISPQKARLVIDLIRGKSYAEADTILRFSKKRAAVLVRTALNAAYSNATQDENVNTRRLVVTECHVDAGPTMKRWQPKDRGRAHPINKRTSHITVTVDEK